MASREDKIKMKRTLVVVVLNILTVVCTSAASDVYWTPAHELAPPGTTNGPVAADLDGDLDYDISGLRPEPAQHFWNIGSPQTPQWVLDTSQFLEITGCIHRLGDMADVDADGDVDLAVGCTDGRLRLYWNVGTPQAPVWQYDPAYFLEYDGPDGSAAPRFADLDADGDLDILVTRATGLLGLLRNVGGPQDPAWVYEGLVVGISWAAAMWSSGAVADMDGDGDQDYVRIDSSSPLRCWENVGTPQMHQFVENPQMLIGVNEPQTGGSGVELFDVDADGDPDLLVSWGFVTLLYLNSPSTAVERFSTWGRIKALYSR